MNNGTSGMLEIGGRRFRAKTVRTPRAIARGMMGKTFKDVDADAMVFEMGGASSSKEHSFYMKNCIIPLDVLFVEGSTITKIHRNCPPCEADEKECKTYPGRGDRVIEMLGGTCARMGIREGDDVRFTASTGAPLKALIGAPHQKRLSKDAPGTRRGSRRYRNRRPYARTTRRSGRRYRG